MADRAQKVKDQKGRDRIELHPDRIEDVFESAKSILVPRGRDQAIAQLAALYGGSENIDEIVKRKITFRCIADKADETTGKKRVLAPICGTFPECWSKLYELNKQGYGVFFLPNYTGTVGTKDEDVLSAKAVWIDIDKPEDPELWLDPESYALPPSAIFRREDNGGIHVYWTLPAAVNDLEKWSAVQKTLIAYYRSDPSIHNPARLMRLAGTMNHKTPAAPMYIGAGRTFKDYTLDELTLAHGDEEARLKRARTIISAYFKKKGGKLNDGDGRHAAMVKTAFILNDYGIHGEAAAEELRRVNKSRLADPYTVEELEQFVGAQKHAKNEPGAQAVSETLKQAAIISAVRDAMQGWYYVSQQNAFFREGEDSPYTVDAFNNIHAQLCDGGKCSKIAFNNGLIRMYENFDYNPAVPAFDLPITATTKRRNTYIAPDIEPVAVYPDWFVGHVEYIIPEKFEREHFLNFLAYIVQNPGEKVRHGCVIIGRQGIGKSMMQKVFTNIFGLSNISAPHNENLAGNFTGWAKHCQLVVINELLQGDKKEFLNKIKPFITEPEIEVREMYRAPYTIKNHMNFIAFTNSDTALYLDKDDRRFFIVNSPATKREPEYYDAFVKAAETRSGEVLHYLLERDISNFRPGAEPPMTTAKAEMIEYSISDLEMYIKDGVESEAAPFDADLVVVQDVRDALPINLKNNFATVNRLSKILRDQGARKLGRHRIGGARKYVWSIRNHSQYRDETAQAEAVRKIYGADDSAQGAESGKGGSATFLQ